MCTLLLGRDVVAPGTVLLAANRDEDPRRPTDAPGVLSGSPRVVGGRDKVSGGTWLAVRGREAAVAMLNRSGLTMAPAASFRSRGLLALETASVAPDFLEQVDPSEHRMPRLMFGEDPPLTLAALIQAQMALDEASYAPFSMVFASPTTCWQLALKAPTRNPDGTFTRWRGTTKIGAGWHAITHRDLDDRQEPRTARMLDALEGFRPRSLDEAIGRMAELLRTHDAPAVCLHEGRMVTVSSSIVWLAADEARYLHVEGRPCERPFVDHNYLLTPTVH